ncbi:hypothetical protein CFOL_v3_22370 [Cephalotus follicularis]|uniref:Uncharacterized protein n=1 Tax=Cephalotus follicularis TaxID=3775 RepID=A0A1Q3CFB6_CEPFO|nr:hypothetical protein CFOL_v3_22370 [Cephalotus follicularis]
MILLVNQIGETNQQTNVGTFLPGQPQIPNAGQPPVVFPQNVHLGFPGVQPQNNNWWQDNNVSQCQNFEGESNYDHYGLNTLNDWGQNQAGNLQGFNPLIREEITNLIQKNFGLGIRPTIKPMYRKPYLEWIDRVHIFPREYRVPEFITFFVDGTQSTI